jgi:DNA-binding NtrC family response regulator
MAEPSMDTALGVLIVDDERPIVDLLKLYLGQQGLRVRGAYTPEEAVEAVRADPVVGVVITDLRMPGMSGPALADELLRDRGEAQAMELVVITGAGAGDPALEALRGLAFEVLRKPFRPTEVAGAVGRAMASAGQRRRDARGAADAAQGSAGPGRAELVATMLLDLRGPLGPLLAEAQALATAPPQDAAELRARAQRLHDAARRIAALLDEAEAAFGGQRAAARF